MLDEESGGERGENGREKGGEFDDPVAPAQFGFGEEFGEERVFRWAEDCALSAGEKESKAGEVDAIVREREGGERHDDEFEDLYSDCDGALAVFVGEISAGDGEDQKGNGKEEWDDKNEPEVALIFVGEGFENEKADEPFERVVAECVLKLDGDESLEAAQAAWRSGRNSMRSSRSSRVDVRGGVWG
jgi:hypothetical protein